MREQQRDKEPLIEVKTLVKQENDNEVFVTDAEDVDFDKMNESHMQEIYKLLMAEN